MKNDEVRSLYDRKKNTDLMQNINDSLERIASALEAMVALQALVPRKERK